MRSNTVSVTLDSENHMIYSGDLRYVTRGWWMNPESGQSEMAVTYFLLITRDPPVKRGVAPFWHCYITHSFFYVGEYVTAGLEVISERTLVMTQLVSNCSGWLF
jgi:hypothetical protein